MNFRFGKVSKVPATVYFLSILMSSFVIGVGVASWVRMGTHKYAMFQYDEDGIAPKLPFPFHRDVKNLL